MGKRLQAPSVLLGLLGPFLCCSQAGRQPSQAGAVPSSSKLLVECVGKEDRKGYSSGTESGLCTGTNISVEPLDAAASGAECKAAREWASPFALKSPPDSLALPHPVSLAAVGRNAVQEQWESVELWM